MSSVLHGSSVGTPAGRLRRRMRGTAPADGLRLPAILAAVAAVLLTWPAGAAAARVEAAPIAAPDSARLAGLRARLAGEDVVRIIGPGGARDVFHPVIDSTGISAGGRDARIPRRPAVFVMGGLPPAPAPVPVPWSEITAVQAGGGAAGRGLLVGTAAALGIAAAVLVVEPRRTGEFGDPRYLWLAAPLPLAGFVIGSKLGWRTVYP